MSIGFVAQPPFRALKNDVHDKSKDIQEMIKNIATFEKTLNGVMNKNNLKEIKETKDNMRPLFSYDTVKAIRKMKNHDSPEAINGVEENER